VESVDAFIGLGSNVEGPVNQVCAAFDALATLPATAVAACSPLYGSRPMGPQDQPDFVNAVAWLHTELSPHELLAELQRLEADAGRERGGQRWGPRPLDLDLLVWNGREMADDRLTLPHPGIAERAFVLCPFADIAPDFPIPGVGRAAACCGAVAATSVWRLDEP